MAKKAAPKKAARPTSKKTAKKSPAAKSSKPAKKTSGAGKGGEFKASTGSGPGPDAIGANLVALFNSGKFQEIEHKWWSPSIESIEGAGVNMGWRGRAAVEAKNAGWTSAHTIRGASAEGPYLGSTGFAVKFRMDIEEKATGKRWNMEEVGVYTVNNGKIIREEFMYGSKTEQTSAAPTT